MKRVLLLTFLLWASLASATVFTAIASADWNTGTTWNGDGTNNCHTGIPCMTDTYSGGPSNGDVVNLSTFQVTCTGTNEVCSVGASDGTATGCTAGTAAIASGSGASLRIGPTATFIYAGSSCVTKLIVDGGGKLYHDSSWSTTPASYQFTDNTSSPGWCLGDASCGATAGGQILWEGDSYSSPNACRLGAQGCNTHCATVNTAGCKSGSLAGGTGAANGIGYGTVTNVKFQNIVGQSNDFWYWRVNSAGKHLTFKNVTVVNSGILGVRPAGASTMTLDGVYCTAMSAPGGALGQGWIIYGAIPSGGAAIMIKNSYLECPITGRVDVQATNYQNTVFKLPWSAGTQFTAGTSNLTSGITSTDVSTSKQVLMYYDNWNAGAESANGKGLVTGSFFYDSVLYIPRNVNTGSGAHLHPAVYVWNNALGGIAWEQKNNVFDAFGDVETSPTTIIEQVGYPGGGIPSVANTTLEVSGNVQPCGAYGRGTLMGAGGFYSTILGKAMAGTPTIAITASTQTFTRSTGSFTADGFVVGMNLYAYGTTSVPVNDRGPFTIATVGTTTLTVNDPGGILTDLAATSGITVTATWWKIGDIKIHNNTQCSAVGSLTAAVGVQNGGGFYVAETISGLRIADINANLFYRNDVVASGNLAVPEIFSYTATPSSTLNDPSLGGVESFHSVNYNSVINTAVGIAPCSTNPPTCNWVVIPPTTGTEIIIQSTTPKFVDPYRSSVLFQEYLTGSGIFNESSYSTPATIDLGSDVSLPATGSGAGATAGATSVTTAYQGAWSSSFNGHGDGLYHYGDIVYVDSSVTGYSAIYGGRKSYWVCKITHAPGATNKPIIGTDAITNPFIGATEYWEDAWLSLWLKPSVLAGNIYGDSTGGSTCTNSNACNDGSLTANLYSSTTTYAVGLLNRWVRSGYVGMDARLWGAAQGTTGCSTDQGSSFTECGAMALPMVRHTPPVGNWTN